MKKTVIRIVNNKKMKFSVRNDALIKELSIKPFTCGMKGKR